jgi:hypothetical protein
MTIHHGISYKTMTSINKKNSAIKILNTQILSKKNCSYLLQIKILIKKGTRGSDSTQ